ncbi:MAG TPA: penicillin acylase family protein [Leptospiraceae bacterium]|nr:penicillin acylase family protein [Leptospiraceae bacterium]
MRRVYKIVRIPLLLLVVGLIWSNVRYGIINRPLPVDPAWTAQAKNVTIIRDEWGVPHIKGKTDADAAFGLAYAHCEDDFKFIQGGMVAARGDLARLVISKEAVVNDFYVRLFKIRERADRDYDKISPDFRKVLEAYANGVNYYAATHPSEAKSKFFPASGKDIAAGFIHKIPLFIGADKAMQKIMGDQPLRVDDPLDNAVAFQGLPVGSNAHALSHTRTADGATYLNINSHQPWEGPVAWYEAHVQSEEGWNMTGGTFPGAPFILHGHNDHLGWAHTVNYPDLVDVYKLKLDEQEDQYMFDGQLRPLNKTSVRIQVDIGLFDLPIPMSTYESAQGPVLKSDHGKYAVRVSGIDRLIFAGEQWYRMNKARNLTEWKKAMQMQAIPMFNAVYADASNIFYVYNASLPTGRVPNQSYRKVLPGDTSQNIWDDKILPFAKLPDVENPPSGFIQNCNSSPFETTTGPGNPDPGRYSLSMGIEKRSTNRSMRSRELLSKPGKISFEDFLRMKWDRTYAPRSPIYEYAINPLLRDFKPQNEDESQALELLRKWNGRADDSPGSSLAILVYRPIWQQTDLDHGPIPDRAILLRDAISFLKKHYGKLDVPLSILQRMRHGHLDEGLVGGPDVLNAAHSLEEKDHIVGVAGDSYVLIVQFQPANVKSWSIHQYGNSTHKGSAHFADQMPLFLKRTLKSTFRDVRDLNEHTECQYHPGGQSCAEARD